MRSEEFKKYTFFTILCAIIFIIILFMLKPDEHDRRMEKIEELNAISQTREIFERNKNVQETLNSIDSIQRKIESESK